MQTTNMVRTLKPGLLSLTAIANAMNTAEATVTLFVNDDTVVWFNPDLDSVVKFTGADNYTLHGTDSMTGDRLELTVYAMSADVTINAVLEYLTE